MKTHKNFYLLEAGSSKLEVKNDKINIF